MTIFNFTIALDVSTKDAKVMKRNMSVTSVASNVYSQIEKLLHKKSQHEKREQGNEKAAGIIKEESSETGRVSQIDPYQLLNARITLVSRHLSCLARVRELR